MFFAPLSYNISESQQCLLDPGKVEGYDGRVTTPYWREYLRSSNDFAVHITVMEYTVARNAIPPLVFVSPKVHDKTNSSPVKRVFGDHQKKNPGRTNLS